MTDAYPLAARGVYAQPYLHHGQREFYAVDSRGEHVASRVVRAGADPKDAISALWEELNDADPSPGVQPERRQGLTLIR